MMRSPKGTRRTNTAKTNCRTKPIITVRQRMARRSVENAKASERKTSRPRTPVRRSMHAPEGSSQEQISRMPRRDERICSECHLFRGAKLPNDGNARARTDAIRTCIDQGFHFAQGANTARRLYPELR